MVRRRRYALIAAVWLFAHTARAQPREEPSSKLDLDLAREARMEWITRAALERSPALAEAGARVRAGSERASEAARLPDLEFKYEQWGVPLSRPWDLSQANMVMFGVRQSFPAPGTRQARARTVREDANMAGLQRQMVQRDLLRRVRRAYFEYWAAARALEAHAEHVAIAEQTVAQLQATYAVGRGNQQALLGAQVALSRMHADVVETNRQRDTARYLLNTLMARDTDAPLGPPALDLWRTNDAVDPAAIASQRGTERPEIALANSAVRRSHTTIDAAKHAARRPSFMVGVDYWLMPLMDSPHAYGAMLAMSLPWINPAHRAELRAAEATARADRSAAAATKDVARFELYESIASLRAAGESLRILEEQVLPHAEKSLEAARSTFAVGQSDALALLDAMRSLYEVHLDQIRASARVMAQLAEVEFVSGAPIFDSFAASQARP